MTKISDPWGPVMVPEDPRFDEGREARKQREEERKEIEMEGCDDNA